MQITNDVHNYMETLIGQELAQAQYAGKFDRDELGDIACLALNQLRPVYIRHDIDYLSALSEDKLVVLKQQSEEAVTKAVTMIEEDRRDLRKKDDKSADIPPPSSDGSFESEWYDRPILVKRPHQIKPK